jgi:integrase
MNTSKNWEKTGKFYADKFRTRRGVLVFKYVRGGSAIAHFSMRVTRNRKEYLFPLAEDKREASRLADEIDRFLSSPVSKIEDAIQRYRPAKWERLHPEIRAASVGAVLDAHKSAEKAAGITPRTAMSYRNAMLQLFREGLAQRQGAEPTEDQIRAMSLEELNPRLASDYKQARLASAGENRADIERRKRGVNFTHRSVRGLFSRSVLPHYSHLKLPPGLDAGIAAIEFRAVEKKKYRLPPQAVIEKVLTEAGELREKNRNAYLLWLLAAHAGFRRNEAAHAIREWIQPGTPPRIWVRATADFLAKGKDEGFAEVEQWVIDEIEALGGPALIMSGNITERYYDAPAYLNDWLKQRGLGAGKHGMALHALRALFGSYVASTRGIFTAQRFLRHATVDVTNDHYADVVLDKAVLKLWTDRPEWAPVPADHVEVLAL